MENRPKVGLGVIVKKDGKVLFGKRKNAHGDGSWCMPGGHLEFNESWEECAARETMEETGLKIKNIRFVTATNDIFFVEEKHYITIYMVADYESGDLCIFVLWNRKNVNNGIGLIGTVNLNPFLFHNRI